MSLKPWMIMFFLRSPYYKGILTGLPVYATQGLINRRLVFAFINIRTLDWNELRYVRLVVVEQDTFIPFEVGRIPIFDVGFRSLVSGGFVHGR